MHGPIPKRSDQRRRRNKPDGAQLVKTPAGPPSPPPPGDPGWHPIVQQVFASLGESGMAQFYEATDWAFARLTCDFLSRCISEPRPSPTLLDACSNALGRLGATEGDRRSMRIALERQPEQEPASVSLMEEYRGVAGRVKRGGIGTHDPPSFAHTPAKLEGREGPR